MFLMLFSLPKDPMGSHLFLFLTFGQKRRRGVHVFSNWHRPARAVRRENRLVQKRHLREGSTPMSTFRGCPLTSQTSRFLITLKEYGKVIFVSPIAFRTCVYRVLSYKMM